VKTALRVLVLIAFVGVAAAIVNGNRETVAVDLVFGQYQLPTWELILVPLGIGIALAGALFAWPMLRLRLRLRKLQTQVGTLEQEVHGLRTLPLGDPEELAQPAATQRSGT